MRTLMQGFRTWVIWVLVYKHSQSKQWQEAYEVMIREGHFADLSRWGGNVILLELCQSLLLGNWKPELPQALIIYTHIASVYEVLGQNQKALEYLEKDLQASKAAGDREGEGMTLNNLGWVYKELGQSSNPLRILSKHWQSAEK